VGVKELVKPFVPDFIIEAARGGHEGIERFAFDKDLDVSRDIQDKYGYNGVLLDFFAANKGSAVHKWHHFIPLYERYFSSFRGRKIRFLEIGVSKGGSLQMWRKYFGDDAIIFGIDIDAECAQFNGLAGQVRIGSQADRNFLESVVNEMGGVDVVLDDGSHHMEHITASLTYLFPNLSVGGIYMIEDLHTAYWKSWGGGYGAKTNFFRFVMDLVDDIHHWYHNHELKQPAISNTCSGIHIHDSIVVLEKNKVYEPVHSINT
jgi:hypothetical protein